MKVILISDVKGLGKNGDIVNAKTGHARNFLLPNNLAVEATKENMENWKTEQKEMKIQKENEKEAAMELKNKIENAKVIIKAKTGEEGKLFGSITNGDIAKELKKQCNIEVEKKKIELKENIREVVSVEVPVRVYPEVTAKLKVEIVSE